VMLTQEVQHVHNYIDLNQLRFHHQLQVQFEVEGTLHFALILPLVLITFVENCFKHGELGEAADPLVIHLAVARNQLTFRTRNKKRLGPKEKSGGIGLANTRQRLELAYPNRHALAVEDGPLHYTCTLTLDL
jgi:LytS/YehU family sensor histidine kinase